MPDILEHFIGYRLNKLHFHDLFFTKFTKKAEQNFANLAIPERDFYRLILYNFYQGSTEL
jgi:hypothetical protein